MSNISDDTKKYIMDHRESIEILQNSIIHSMAGILYLKYIQGMREHKLAGGKITRILVPGIHQLRFFLKNDGEFATNIKILILEALTDFQSSIPESIRIFEYDNKEFLRDVINRYIYPNAERFIPDAISRKFDLMNQDQKNFIEDPRCDVKWNDDVQSLTSYIIDQMNLWQFVAYNQERYKKSDPSNKYVVENDGFFDIISITNPNEICPIYINPKILYNNPIMDIIKFTTNISTEQLYVPKISVEINSNDPTKIIAMVYDDNGN